MAAGTGIIRLCHVGTHGRFNPPLANPAQVRFAGFDQGEQMESNELYYRRRASAERIAAQRAVTEQARDRHAKLAEDFALRAQSCTVGA